MADPATHGIAPGCAWQNEVFTLSTSSGRKMWHTVKMMISPQMINYYDNDQGWRNRGGPGWTVHPGPPKYHFLGWTGVDPTKTQKWALLTDVQLFFVVF